MCSMSLGPLQNQYRIAQRSCLSVASTPFALFSMKTICSSSCYSFNLRPSSIAEPSPGMSKKCFFQASFSEGLQRSAQDSLSSHCHLRCDRRLFFILFLDLRTLRVPKFCFKQRDSRLQLRAYRRSTAPCVCFCCLNRAPMIGFGIFVQSWRHVLLVVPPSP